MSLLVEKFILYAYQLGGQTLRMGGMAALLIDSL